MKSCALASRAACSIAAMLRARPAIGDVLGQRSVEQDRLLLHDCDLAAQ